MRIVLFIAVLLGVSGCGCTIERHDPRGVGNYWDGCWDAARDNRHDTPIFPNAGG